MPIPAIAAGAQLLGSFMSSNQQKNENKANAAGATSLDNQILQIYNSMAGLSQGVNAAVDPAGSLGAAKNFYQSEVAGGLDPAVSNAAISQFNTGATQGLNTLKSQLGPYTPNMPGTIQNFLQNVLQGRVGLSQQLAGLNQQTRQQGAAGLAGVADSALGFSSGVAGQGIGALSNIASGFGPASMFNSQNAQNPFSFLSSFLTQYPNLFGAKPGGSLGTPTGGVNTAPATGNVPSEPPSIPGVG